MEIINSLSNREIATLVWMVVILSVLIYVSKSSKAFLDLIKCFFAKKLTICYLIFIVYLGSIIYILNRIGLWENYLFKDFLFWFFGVALFTFFGFTKIHKNRDLLNLTLKTFSMTLFLEFIINFYNFSLLEEFIFIPFISFIAILQIFAETYKEREGHQQVSNLLKTTLSYVGFTLIAYVTYKTFY
ncbi:MAG: hypothetical protein H7239_13595 [Flavobacterium sp.]|nr:hypothetical protein [Flavobacterium sp.]